MSNLILLSGGLDSALCLSRYGAALALGVDYGQPHVIELDYAVRLAAQAGVHFEKRVVPTMPRVNDVVFAGRNAVLLSIAAAVAQERGLDNVIIGCNFSDAQRFPDCRPEFIRGMNAALAAYGVKVYAPLLTSTKAMILAECKERGITETWTCYEPRGELPCGKCYSCKGPTHGEARRPPSEEYGYVDIMHTSIGAPR